MSIDWKKEAENRKDEMLADLKTMLEIESVRDESKGTPEAPLGPGPKEALDKFGQALTEFLQSTLDHAQEKQNAGPEQ